MKNIIKTVLSRLINSIEIQYFKIDVGNDVKFNGMTRFTCERKRTICIGAGTVVNSGGSWNMIGGDTRTVLRTVAQGKINIGRHVGISNSALVSGGAGIIVEDNVFIGGGCKIYDTDFHSTIYTYRMQSPDPDIHTKSVCLGEGCFIGAHSIILKGVTVGRGAVVGAGSVVAQNVPTGEIWAGNPARFIREVTENE